MATPTTFNDPAAVDLEEKETDIELAPEESHQSESPTTSGVSQILEEKDVEAQAAEVSQPDENVVWWDEPVDQDPDNPMNWGAGRKWGTIAILAFITFITPLASSFFAPAVPLVMKDFKSDNELLAEFVVSIYILGFAFGPLIIAPLSEIYGRAPLYVSCNILFIIFSVACGLSKNMGMLVAFRFLLGCAGASPLTLGGGTIADMIPQEKRGGSMAIWAMGPLVGPVIGPVCGGYLSQAKGWRWIYWVLAMVSGAASTIAFILLKETYPPVILARKAARLRKETGNQALRSKLDSGITPKELFKRAIFRPMKMLFLSPIVASLCWYTAVAYGLLYLLFTTYTFVFEDVYHFSTGTVGLTYIGTGVGMFTGLGILGTATDRVLKKRKAAGLEMKPEHRMPLYLTVPTGLCMPAGLFLYGWTTDKDVHWIVPLIGTAFIGFAMLSIFVGDDFLACLRVELTALADDNQHIPRGCIHHPCRICNGCKHRSAFNLWRRTTSLRPKDVWQTGPRMGQQVRLELWNRGTCIC